MKDEYIGKHIKERETKTKIKNNPIIIDATTIKITAAALAAMIVTGAVIGNVANKLGLDPFSSKTTYENVDEHVSKDQMLSLLDNYRESTTSPDKQLMVDILQWYINSTNSTEINNQNVKEVIYSSFDSTYTKLGYIKVPRMDIDDETYKYVVDNIDIMNSINEHSLEYNVPIPVSIGLSCMDDTIVKSDPLNFNNWDKIDSTQTVYNFVTGNKDNLFKQVEKCHMNTDNSIKYSDMVIRQCLKESGGILYSNNDKLDALDYYIDKDYNINQNKMSKIQKDEHNEKKYRILNGILKYCDSFNASIQYKYDSSNNYEEETELINCNIIYDDYTKELDEMYYEIIDYIIEKSETKSLS